MQIAKVADEPREPKQNEKKIGGRTATDGKKRSGKAAGKNRTQARARTEDERN